MSRVTFNMSISLDGFVAGPNDEVDQLFAWYFSGDTEVPFTGSDMVFKVSKASAERFQEAWPNIGAMVTGRRNFDIAQGWGGRPPLGVHHVVLTHHPPQEWIKDGSPFTFVTDSIESAVAEARRHAGDKDVSISSASVMQQAVRAGLLDEIHLDLVPILLGQGVRLFENLGPTPIELERTQIVAGTGVTHITFRIVK